MALDPRNYDFFGGGGDDGEGGGGYWPGLPAPPVGAPAPAVVVPVPAGGGGGGNGGGGGGGLNYGGLSISPRFNFRPVPNFRPPQFRAPTFADAQNEPGYQFRLSGGRDALEGSAAARGTLRTGGTLKDITEYGQNFASQEYGNVYNRALQSFDRDYRGAYDAFQPRMAEWSMLSGAELQRAMAAFAREWQVYNANHGGGGGGGRGGSFEQDLGQMPQAPGAPPFWWKPGTQDPDVLDWMNHQQPAAPPVAPLPPVAPEGELWPERMGELWPDRF